jgi:periplasmic protein TonB
MRALRMTLMTAACVGMTTAALGQVAGGTTTEAPPPAQTTQPPRARISGGVMAGQIRTRVDPVYPAIALERHLQGMVVLHAIIGKDGHVEKLEVMSGPKELREAATDAVSQWAYKPYLLNHEPVEVDTTIVVNFNLTR